MFTFPFFSPKTRDTLLSSCFLKRSLSASMPWGHATKLLMRNSIAPSIEQHRTQCVQQGMLDRHWNPEPDGARCPVSARKPCSSARVLGLRPQCVGASSGPGWCKWHQARHSHLHLSFRRGPCAWLALLAADTPQHDARLAHTTRRGQRSVTTLVQLPLGC